MAAHVVRIAAVTFVLVACMFLPFLPGGYDPFASTVAGLSQLLGLVSLVFVPIGAGWLVFGSGNRSFYFAIASVVIASILSSLVTLGSFVASGPTLGVLMLACSAYWVRRIAPRVRRMRNAGEHRFNPAPLYMLVVPTVAALCWFFLLGPAIEFSRNRAMQNSAELIREIEAYGKANGKYPTSLLALNQDYRPGVVGIERYYYEPNGDGYDLYFEQLSDVLGTREIVMYNPRDEHSLPSHDSDLLRWTPEELRARPGHYAIHDTSTPHWKYFWFD